jgi:integrase
VAAATRKKHQAILSRFLAYRGRGGPDFNSVAPCGNEILEWLAVSSDLVQAGTVLAWMGSLKAALTDMGIDASVFDTREFKLFRQGIKRVKGEHAPRTALPITLPILSFINHAILRSSNMSSYDRLLLAMAYAIAFSCFLRIGELAYTTFDPLLHLQRKDVLFYPEGICLRLKGSKMDQSRKGVILPLPRIDNPAYKHICPSHLLCMFLTAFPAAPEAPLFSFSSTGMPKFDAKRLVREYRQALIMNGFSVTDMDGRVFSGHSFRRGAATWAAKMGLGDREIMRLGRWSLKSTPGGHQRYIDFTIEDHRDLVSSLYYAAPLGAPRDVGFDLDRGDVAGEEYEEGGH